MENNNASNESTPRRRKKQRGGQPGNRNALKHGFYSSFITPAERRKLRQAEGLVGLGHEIDLLRVKLGKMASDPNVNGSQIAAAMHVIGRLEAVDFRIRKSQEDEDALLESVRGILNMVRHAVGDQGFLEWLDDSSRWGADPKEGDGGSWGMAPPS